MKVSAMASSLAVALHGCEMAGSTEAAAGGEGEVAVKAPLPRQVGRPAQE